MSCKLAIGILAILQGTMFLGLVLCAVAIRNMRNDHVRRDPLAAPYGDVPVMSRDLIYPGLTKAPHP